MASLEPKDITNLDPNLQGRKLRIAEENSQVCKKSARFQVNMDNSGRVASSSASSGAEGVPPLSQPERGELNELRAFYHQVVRKENDQELQSLIVEYVVRLEFKFYAAVYDRELLLKRGFLEELAKERFKVDSEIFRQSGEYGADLMNLEHLALLEAQPRHAQILAFYREVCPDDKLLYCKVRSLELPLFEPPDFTESFLPYGADLLKRIEQDEQKVKAFRCEQRNKDLFFQLQDLVKKTVRI